MQICFVLGIAIKDNTLKHTLSILCLSFFFYLHQTTVRAVFGSVFLQQLLLLSTRSVVVVVVDDDDGYYFVESSFRHLMLL